MSVLVRNVLDQKGSMVATVGSGASLVDAAEVMTRFRVGAVVVSDGARRIDGILSERDLARVVAQHGPAGLDAPVSSAMTAEVHTCRLDDALDQLMVVMTERRFRHLPVVDGDGLMIGIVSIGDVVKHRVTELEAENGTLHEYLYSGR